MNDYIKGFLTGILFSFLSIQASAQHTLSKSFDIRTEGVRPKFTKLFCDSKGLIWTGTDKGIFTFDGINFSKLSGSDSLAPGIVTAMYEDRSGLIWVGFDNGKLVKIGEQFQVIILRKASQNLRSLHLLKTNPEFYFLQQKVRAFIVLKKV